LGFKHYHFPLNRRKHFLVLVLTFSYHDIISFCIAHK
jgi:hypothetical protein